MTIENFAVLTLPFRRTDALIVTELVNATSVLSAWA